MSEDTYLCDLCNEPHPESELIEIEAYGKTMIVSQKCFDQHMNKAADYDHLKSKYRTALRQIEQLQRQVVLAGKAVA